MNVFPLAVLLLAGLMWVGASLLLLGSALASIRPARQGRPPQL